jgi:Family of unknown function (DUF6022)
MNQLLELLSTKGRSVYTIVSYLQSYIEEHYQRTLDKNREQFLRIFTQVGEPAYGAFGRALFQPVAEVLSQCGITCKNGLPGNLQTSIERWGPPEDRERCLWSALCDSDGATLGTIVTRLFHDHTQFRLPRPPHVFALDETDSSNIFTMLSCASLRIPGGEEYRGAFLQIKDEQGEGEGWEFSAEIGLADGIERGRTELTEGLLDHALALWGRYGWELVTVVPHQGELLAFFKRAKRKRPLHTS